MKARSALAALLAVVAGVLLFACPGPTFVVQQYKGPQQASTSIAILRVNGSDAARLVVLDDEDVAAPLDRDARLHIEILPGRHSLVVMNAPGARAGEGLDRERSPVITFQADAGKVYRAVFGPDGVAHVFEVNRSSDALLGDATVPFTPEPITAPRPVRDAGTPATVEDSGAEAASPSP